MNIIEFFNDAAVELPIKWESGSFEELISKVLQNYLKKVSALEEEPLNIFYDIDSSITKKIKRNIDSIEYLCNSIKNIISIHSCDEKSAHSEFDSVISRMVNSIQMLNSDNSLDKQTLLSTDPLYLYRMRKNKKGRVEPFNIKEIFHIPFNEAKRIGDKGRYSFLEEPCLYLGRSIYLCWEELGRPAVTEFQVSRFEIMPNSEANILNFGYRPALLAAMIYKYKNDIIKDFTDFVLAGKLSVPIAIWWPLIAACSIATSKDKENRDKIEEYIIPKMLLRWVKKNNNGYFGIRYFSTQINNYLKSPNLYQNFVFPAEERDPDDDLCKRLKKIFTITEPVDYETAKKIIETANEPKTDYIKKPKYHEEEIDLNGKKVRYGDSPFGLMEIALMNRIPKSL